MPGLKKGAKIKVEPIRKKEDIKAISQLLEEKPRDLLLWTMGINNGLKAGDLVRLKVSQVQDLKPGDSIRIVETSTGKDNALVINDPVYKTLQVYLDQISPDPDDYLFRSRKGSSHISGQSVGRLVKTWTTAVNLEGNYGAHTLYKTWGYHQRIKDIAFETIKDSIMNGSLICGKIYSENRISKDMGISKTPVHEALLELRHKGFIEILPKKGFLVKDLSEKEIRDIYGLRLALERVVVANAAQKSKEKDIIFLKTILDKIKGGRDVMRFMVEAIGFHRYLAQLNGNDQIVNALNRVWDLCIWIGLKTLAPDTVLDEIVDRHFVLLDHIKNRNSKAAEAILEEHINISLDRILKAYFPA